MNLRQLLKRDSQRQLELIETLYYSQRPRSSEELAKITQCTPPALLSDIRSINTQSDYYKIVRENSLYHLEIMDNATIDVLFSTLLSNSITFKILESIFFEECSTLQELAKKFFCSLTAVQSSMKKLEEALSHWKLEIVRRPFQITGDETAIRHLFFLYFSEKKVTRENNRFSPQFFHYGDQVVQSLLSNNSFSVSFAQYNRVSLYFFISLVRISKGHQVTPRSLKSTSHVPPSEEAISRLSPYLRKELQLVYSEDVMKDSFWLLYSDQFLLSEEQKNRALQTNFLLTYHHEIHYELAEKLSNMLITPLTTEEKEQLTTILINQHMFHAHTKEFISVLQDRKRDCLRSLDAFHAHCVHQIRNLVTEFTRKHQLFNSPEFIDNYIYQIIATVPSCLNGMKQSEKPVDLLVISKDSKMQESLLIEMLRLSLRGNYDIHQMDFTQLQSKGHNINQVQHLGYSGVFEKYDVVISTSTFDVPECKAPVIAVELCPSIPSLNKIQKLIDQIHEQKTVQT